MVTRSNLSALRTVLLTKSQLLTLLHGLAIECLACSIAPSRVYIIKGFHRAAMVLNIGAPKFVCLTHALGPLDTSAVSECFEQHLGTGLEPTSFFRKKNPMLQKEGYLARFWLPVVCSVSQSLEQMSHARSM